MDNNYDRKDGYCEGTALFGVPEADGGHRGQRELQLAMARRRQTEMTRYRLVRFLKTLYWPDMWGKLGNGSKRVRQALIGGDHLHIQANRQSKIKCVVNSSARSGRQ